VVVNGRPWRLRLDDPPSSFLPTLSRKGIAMRALRRWAVTLLVTVAGVLAVAIPSGAAQANGGNWTDNPTPTNTVTPTATN
jgi:hypothetical protein